MASTPASAPMAALFNNDILSDVTIKQISKGKVREYYAHKAILCARSEYFIKQFTSTSKKKESHSTIEVHDDDPDDFALALKFIYSSVENDSPTIKGFIKDCCPGDRAMKAIGAWEVGNKYAIRGLEAAALHELHETLKADQDENDEGLIFAIKEYYSTCTDAQTPVGIALARLALQPKRVYTTGESFDQDLGYHTAFAADIATQSRRDGLLKLHMVTCPNIHCNTVFAMGLDRLVKNIHSSCPHCSMKYPGWSWK